MSFNPYTRARPAHNFAQIADSSDFEEDEATYTNSEAPRTSPAPSVLEDELPAPHVTLNGDDLSDYSDDSDFRIPQTRAPRMSSEEKTLAILSYLRSFHKFSLRDLLETMFRSDNSDIRAFTGHFLKDEDAVKELMDILWEKGQRKKLKEGIVEWVVKKAAEECEKECSYLTDRAAAGPHSTTAEALKVPVHTVKVSHVREFRFPVLLDRYEKTTPYLQCILKAPIGKEGRPTHASSRNPDDGRTTITSMILNLRSRQTNYHALVNTFLLWQTGASKRLIQILNRLGFCMSYDVQGRAIVALTKDSNRLSREAARNVDNVKELAYDNFNWRKRAWELSALHGSIQHDQVSAMLIILHIDTAIRNQSAVQLMDIRRFDEHFGARHRLSMGKSLERISPTAQDHQSFRAAVSLHIQEILIHDLKSFARFRHTPRSFSDPKAIVPHVTERHYLPTFDQEQGSTRGNMVVLSHYLQDVLQMPKSSFEHQGVIILGDRLTTARDRAAQDQRAVDRSSDRADHLSSIVLSSGMMHQCLNMIMAIARTMSGEPSAKDNVSLLTLRDLLPNRESLNLKKIDFYAWLRFLDVVLRAFIVTSVYAYFNTKDVEHIIEATKSYTAQDFTTLCSRLADDYVLPLPRTLERSGIKTLQGETECGHAVTIAHALMTMREMRHAIKHGHPTRMLRMLKFWTPMFYAGASYNYSNECMELLHNVHGDWPEDSADVIVAGMLVNTSGRANGFIEGDLDVEHLNKIIKGRAHGVNASPSLLERITPALGQVRHLTEHICEDLRLNELNQYHTAVRQDKDVTILVEHLLQANVFLWDSDTASTHEMVHLFYDGQRKLGGADGGHAKHLLRHQLRLRTRHSVSEQDLGGRDVEMAALELTNAIDAQGIEFELENSGDLEDNTVLQFPSLEELN